MEKINEQEIIDIFAHIQQTRGELDKLEAKLKEFQQKVAYLLVKNGDAAER